MPTIWTKAQDCAMTLKERDILVSAAAGSGKTATLTERIIRSLTETDRNGKYTGDITRMLIVTYTRAAAAKLRSDISAALSAAIAEHPDDTHLYAQLTLLGSAHISTIDSFCLEPVQAHFERLGLPSSFRIAEKPEMNALKEEVFARVLEEMYHRYAPVEKGTNPLEALQGNPFAAAMEDILPLRGREGVMLEIIGIYEKLRYYPQGLAILRDNAERLYRESGLPFAASRECALLRENFAQKLRHYIRLLQSAVDTFASFDKFRENYTPAFAEDLHRAERILALLDKGEWEKAREVLLAYEPLKLKAVSGAAELLPDVTRFRDDRDNFKKLMKGADGEYFSSGNLPYAEQMRHTADTEQMLYELLSAYDAALREEKKHRGILDFVDVSRCLLQLLTDENGNPSDVAKSYSDQFDAVYIDEYQDVNAVQDSIFSLIGAGRKRFMVGDMKQSIYRFRGANPGLFTAYRRSFPATEDRQSPVPPTGSNCIFMSDNFRCAKPIIDFANSVSAYTFSACGETIGYRQEDALRQGIPTPAGVTPVPAKLVLLENPSGKEKADKPDTPANAAEKTAIPPEAHYIAREIRRLLAEDKKQNGDSFRLSDIAILMQKKDAANEIIRALSAYGIRTSYAARDQLAEHPDTILLYNLLSVIDNPRDDVPLMGLLTSSDSPADLSAVLKARSEKPDEGLTLYDAVSAAAESDPASPFASFCRWLERWRRLAATLPVDRLLRKLYGEPKLADRATTAPFLMLYDIARKYQNASFCGLYQFLRHFRELREDPDNLSAPGLITAQECVTLLTIHKSKGLEYPVVFLYGAQRQFNQMDLRAAVYFDEDLGITAPIYRQESASFDETVCRKAISLRMKRQLLEEEMRVLYVALTRPKERLYVTAALSDTADKCIVSATRKHAGDVYDVFSAKCFLDWILPGILSPETAPENPKAAFELCILPRQEYETLPKGSSADGKQTQPDPANTAEREFYATVLEVHRDYKDERAPFRTLPTKAAASRLCSALLDGAWSPEEFGGEESPWRTAAEEITPSCSEAAVRERIALMRSEEKTYTELMAENASADAAERGTATHCFLEHCDFSRLSPGNPKSLDEEIARLSAGGFLPAEWAKILRKKQLFAFLSSNLFTALRRARQYWREVHFDRFVPYSRLTRNPDMQKKLDAFSYTLYVQGSIDLVLEDEEGNLTLVDYKTDRLSGTDETAIREELLRRHADQLSVYADALTEMMGKTPSKIWIYSLPLGRPVDLTADILPPSPAEKKQ